jgi:hypothetical protein
MSNKNLTIDLKARKDVDSLTFYVGRLKGPFVIDCRDGVTFLIFVSEKGSEQLQIAAMEKKDIDD